MAELKTFLFTDVVGSVELKRAMPGRSDAERDQAFIEQILSPHRARIEQELSTHGGRVVSTAGDGHFLVFSDTVLAAQWAVGIQQSHRDVPIHTPTGRNVAVRISVHLGIPQIDPRDENNFVGKTVDYAARLNDFATGGQILVSRSVVAILEDAGMDGVSFHCHGSRDLKGIGPVEIYELVYDATGPRKMRPQPREQVMRQWTVLPATMGLTEFQAAGGRGGGSLSTSVVPSKLGNYELAEWLGGGGMGDVYRAKHVQFGRDRAVKVIKHHFVESGNREVIRRFYQEIKAVGALEHPNIVVAIDSSTPNDRIHYLVMEYVDGISAEELVARNGPLPVADACEIIRQAARGLAYIHQHGMVHRDVKPSNLMLTVVLSDELVSDAEASAEPDGQRALVKILDLGLALLVGDDQQRLTLFDDRPMGTAMYMSPEQWKTTSVDIRADIYSLGCTFYHLLSGKPPYWDSDLRPQKAHEREELRPIAGPHPIPPPLWGILQKMTAKRPDDRYSDPAEVVAALTPWTKGHWLVQLIERTKAASPGEDTKVGPRSDTRAAATGKSDTLLGRTPASRPLTVTPTLGTQPILWRIVKWVAVLTALVVAVWLAVQFGRHRETGAVRQQSLQLAANYAASEIVKEINTRFRILRDAAKDKQLQGWMVQIDREPGNESLWQPLRNWLAAKKLESDNQAPAESWFINSRLGIQVSRSLWSDDTIGRNFSHRDYFHGRGTDLAETITETEPITAPHLSAVYRSTSTGRLKVAFSVPIENGRVGAAKKVVGILAMSVDLGEFNVLENVLDRSRGQEVVLIDLRTDTVDLAPGRGLILHHRRVESYAEGQTPPRLTADLLAKIDALLAEPEGSPDTRNLLLDYADPLSAQSRRKFWGAFERVILNDLDEEPYDTGWLVLVEEPATR